MWLTRHLSMLTAVAVVAAGCISAEPPPPMTDPVVVVPVPTMPVEPLEEVDAATIALVEDYWEARDAAWSAGVEAGLAFTVANNHPLLPYSADDCREAWFRNDPPVGFAERNALDSSSIASDPTFMMSVGPLAGRDLGDGLLKMIVAFAYEGQGLRVADRVAQVHLQVTDDGQARHFLLCEPVDITVVEGTSSAGGTAGGGTTTGTGTTAGTPGAIAGDPVTVLPPITAVPVPVPVPTATTGSGTGGGGTAPAPPPPPGSRPPGSGIDFCTRGSPGAQPVAGDYFLCPDDDIDPNPPTAAPAASPAASEDVTRG